MSEPNYYIFFSEKLLAIEIIIKQILINKPVFLSLSILQLSKIGRYESWFMLNQNMGKKKQNYVTWIQTALYLI